MNKFVMAAGAVLAFAGVPAQASCWTAQQVAAAKVRDFDTMLMVSALRCRFQSHDLANRYNAMVIRHGKGLSEMNGRLGARFKALHGTKEGLHQLDRYVTQVANRYGAGTSEQLSCASLISLADAAVSEAQTADALIALAERAGVIPHTPEGLCPAPVIIAAKPTYQGGIVQAAAASAASKAAVVSARKAAGPPQ